MTKYLKCFQTHSNYNTYITGSDKILPNVSYCENENEVHYNPWTDPKLVCKYNITDISSPTALRTEFEPNMFKSMEIDGELLDSLVTSYQFNTTGEHTVKYELYDETKVGGNLPLFNNSTTLSSVFIPNSVTTISQSAFLGCTGLTSITIPNNVTTIGERAFSNCTVLTSIKVNSGNTVYDSRNNCNAIIETATNTLIAGCQNTVIPNSVTTINGYAFYRCSSLTSITIPNSVTSIGNYAFGYCIGLTSIVVDSGNTVYDSRNNCNAIIETATNTLIAGCKNTVIPNSVTTIRNYVFEGCSSLTSITIPNSVTTIGTSAFSGCIGLTSITIPDSVTTIGNSAFNGCTGLTSITSLATTAPTIQSMTFQSVKTGGTLTVPTGSTGYDVWMGTGNYYLGKYSWAKVEQ